MGASDPRAPEPELEEGSGRDIDSGMTRGPTGSVLLPEQLERPSLSPGVSPLRGYSSASFPFFHILLGDLAGI